MARHKPGADEVSEVLHRVCRCEAVSCKFTSLPLELAKPTMAKDPCGLRRSISQQSFLSVVDAYSKWAEAIVIQQTTTTQTITTLRHVFSVHGLPEEIVLDNGPQFTSFNFMDFTKKNKIHHI